MIMTATASRTSIGRSFPADVGPADVCPADGWLTPSPP
jgi:hypothetical protein